MTKAYDSILQGLTEVEAYLKGDKTGAVTHEIEVPIPDVRAIRAQTGLSQADFARSIGVKKATLLNWEHNRRKPDGPARVLLALIEKEPGIVQRVLV
ncbi:MAG: helix-turn-helix domain-containing protein [Pseudotabrizicola sp.]|uniref:helix-turn-helix domain-containing protein n=1 Tax=Pseudotabrizicola sp. TaxID=2939647 RepID=UPI002726B49F|nr:helix-turn-helix domain-containing protein [Pseudotabrizicola sp.]MDO9640069.1 helix-turn-helix domain-containing protein [Pseudotabrizicola sp.]